MNDPEAEPEKPGTQGNHAVRRRVPLLLVGCALLLFTVGTAHKCLDHESAMDSEGNYSGWVATGAGPAADLYARSQGEEFCDLLEEDWDDYQSFCSTLDWDIAVAAGEGGYATDWNDCIWFGQALFWNYRHEWRVHGEDGTYYDSDCEILKEGLYGAPPCS